MRFYKANGLISNLGFTPGKLEWGLLALPNRQLIDRTSHGDLRHSARVLRQGFSFQKVENSDRCVDALCRDYRGRREFDMIQLVKLNCGLEKPYGTTIHSDRTSRLRPVRFSARDTRRRMLVSGRTRSAVT